jgi:nucleotide-binding universal stress UspA family protein
MKKIAAFIDFTEGCKIALQQANAIAKAANAEIYAVYIMTESGDVTAQEDALRSFALSVPGIPANIQVAVGTGELLEGAAHTLKRIDPDLVVVGTHGIKGIVQHLFGAHILKLVEAIPFPCIVVQENTRVRENGWDKILFPVGSHPGYRLKTEQTAALAKVFHAQIIQYEIEKSPDVDEMQKENTKLAREYFNEHQIPFTYIVEEATVLSVGYSRQELKYASENNIGLISVMAEIAPNDISYGKADMETLLTNEFGIPILCCNE